MFGLSVVGWGAFLELVVWGFGLLSPEIGLRIIVWGSLGGCVCGVGGESEGEGLNM